MRVIGIKPTTRHWQCRILSLYDTRKFQKSTRCSMSDSNRLIPLHWKCNMRPVTPMLHISRARITYCLLVFEISPFTGAVFLRVYLGTIQEQLINSQTWCQFHHKPFSSFNVTLTTFCFTVACSTIQWEQKDLNLRRPKSWLLQSRAIAAMRYSLC